MQVNYVPIDFTIQFSTPAYVDTNPLFVLRSMMGKNLHSMCCISKKSKCNECMYKKTCAYAFLFETILPQENEILPGTDRGSHPFSFSVKKVQRGNPLTDYNFTITLFGKAIEYLPYIYATFVKAGKDGIFKNRTAFDVVDVQIGGNSILVEENKLSMDFNIYEWIFESKELQESTQLSEVFVELKSPLRFKIGGRYGIDFSAKDFMNCLFRRTKTMCSLYGKFDEEKYLPSESLQIVDKKIHWMNYRHYSARQKNLMELGGSIGHLKIEGCFTPFEFALLDFNKIANAGKNTNFGLGQIDVWRK